MPTRRAYALITNGDGRLLIVRNKRGNWGLPGGRARRDESLKHAVQREVLEETGLRIKVGKRLPGKHIRRHRVPCGGCKVFEVRKVKGTAAVQPRTEIRDLRWVRIRKAPKRLTHFRRKRVRRALELLDEIPR